MAAGHDIYAIKAIGIPARGHVLLETGIAVGLPPNTYARLAPRSGLAGKKGIDIGGGVIDADYTGEVKVIMINHSNDYCHIMEGERIAQMIIEKIDMSNAMEVDELEDTIRGEGGFGSPYLSPKRLVQAMDTAQVVCILQANHVDNEFFGEEDINNHTRLLLEEVMVSSMTISKIVLTNYKPSQIAQVVRAGSEDQDWCERKVELNQRISLGQELPKNWQSKDGMPYFKNRLFIPNNDELKTEIVKGCHDSQVAGHCRMEKTIEIVTMDFYWDTLTQGMNDYVRSCDECQYNQSPRHARCGLLQLLETPYAAWTSISTDFITQLPESQGYTQLMVVVDRFTKMAHFIGLPTEATAKHVATGFLREVWKLHGLPMEIISDMDAKFSGEFWESLCKGLGIKRRMSIAYHPQTDGQTERTNQVLEGYLRNFVNYDQDDWFQLLALAEFAYNNSATNAHGLTPFYANYGFHPQTEWMKDHEAQNPGAGLYSHWMKSVDEKAYKVLDQAREAMKKYYNRKAIEQPDLKVGDQVMLNAKNIRTKRPSKKLSQKLYGPCKILEKRGNRAFKLEISPQWKIHPVFHLSLLVPYRTSV